MESLKEKLIELQEKLPKGDEVDIEYLYDIHLMDIEEILGSSRKIWEFQNDTTEKLPDPMQNYFYALWYIQSVFSLFDSINWDGFLSVFYNWSGREINALKTILKKFDEGVIKSAVLSIIRCMIASSPVTVFFQREKQRRTAPPAHITDRPRRKYSCRHYHRKIWNC